MTISFECARIIRRATGVSLLGKSLLLGVAVCAISLPAGRAASAGDLSEELSNFALAVDAAVRDNGGSSAYSYDTTATASSSSVSVPSWLSSQTISSSWTTGEAANGKGGETVTQKIPLISLTSGDATYQPYDGTRVETDCSGWVAYALNVVAPFHQSILQKLRDSSAFNSDGLSESSEAVARAMVLQNYFDSSDIPVVGSSGSNTSGFERITYFGAATSSDANGLRAGDVVAYCEGDWCKPEKGSNDTGHTFIVTGTPVKVVATATSGAETYPYPTTTSTSAIAAGLEGYQEGSGSGSAKVATLMNDDDNTPITGDTLSADTLPFEVDLSTVTVWAVPVVDSSNLRHFGDDRDGGTGLGEGYIYVAVDADGTPIQTRFYYGDAWLPNWSTDDSTDIKLFGAVRLTDTIELTGDMLNDDGYLVVTKYPNGPTTYSQTGSDGTSYSFDAGAITTTLSGSGGVLLQGGGTLVMTGTNTYTGGTIIYGSETTLVVSKNDNLGDSSGHLTFYGGTLSNTASFTSSRAIVLGDDGLNAGGTFDTQADLTLSGVISGTGSLTKKGTATLTLTGADTYTGGTTVNEGTLVVNGSLKSAVKVEKGGTLKGAGTIDGDLVSHGKTSPGTSVATLTVTGDYTQDGGTLEMEHDSSGSDTLVVGGAANLDGTLTMTVSSDAKVTHGQTTDLIQASAVTGAFDSVETGHHFLSASHAISGGTVTLTYSRDFAGVSPTGNQAALGAALNAAHTAGDQGDLDDVFSALDAAGASSAAEGRTALDTLSGQSLGDMTTAAAVRGQVFTRALFGRIDAVRDGARIAAAQTMGAVRVAAAPGGVGDLTNALAGVLAAAPTDGGSAAGGGAVGPTTNLWVRGLGAVGSVRGDGEGYGYDQRGGGVALGVDRDYGDWIIGAAAAYIRSELDSNLGGDETRTATYQLAVYGGASVSGYDLDGSVTYAYDDHDTKRRLSFGGLNRTATASPEGHDLGVALRLSRRVAVGSLDGALGVSGATVWVTPEAGIEWHRLHRSDFTESGAGAANLSVEDHVVNVVSPSLGARLSTRWATDDGMVISPSLRASWRHDLVGDSPEVTATLSGAPGIPYTVRGAEPGRDVGVFGFDIAASGDDLRLFAGYEFAVARDMTNHALTAGLKYTW